MSCLTTSLEFCCSVVITMQQVNPCIYLYDCLNHAHFHQKNEEWPNKMCNMLIMYRIRGLWRKRQDCPPATSFGLPLFFPLPANAKSKIKGLTLQRYVRRRVFASSLIYTSLYDWHFSKQQISKNSLVRQWSHSSRSMFESN